MDTSEDLKPRSLLHTVAEYFHRDAVDFAARFDCLWNAGALMHKMGRTKSFVDLMMGCECALKCDGLLSGLNEDPVIVYKRVRRCGHNIRDLLAHARFCNVEQYEALLGELASMPVHIRYSRDAYDAFFPSLMNQDAAEFNYSRTIGNNTWVLRIRETLEALNASVTKEFSGEVENDLGNIFAHQREFKEFAEACRK
jgi:hypothetical protein